MDNCPWVPYKRVGFWKRKVSLFPIYPWKIVARMPYVEARSEQYDGFLFYTAA